MLSKGHFVTKSLSKLMIILCAYFGQMATISGHSLYNPLSHPIQTLQFYSLSKTFYTYELRFPFYKHFTP